MWQKTKQGIYKHFVFEDFETAMTFVEKAKTVILEAGFFPRWQNEEKVVRFWIPVDTVGESASPEQASGLIEAIDRLAEEFIQQVELEKSDEKKSTQIREVKLYADGGSRGNPGPSASGFVLLDMNDEVVSAHGEYLGITTNNQAEYQALKLGLEFAKKETGARVIHVFMDSLLVINQMKGIFKVRNRDLWPVHESIKKLVAEFEAVSFTHVPRELNKLADAEVNKCLDEHTS